MNSLLECTWIAPQQTPKGRGKCSKNMQELKANVNQMIIIWAQSASWIENHHQVRKEWNKEIEKEKKKTKRNLDFQVQEVEIFTGAHSETECLDR